jgi:hypothetical protein
MTFVFYFRFLFLECWFLFYFGFTLANLESGQVTVLKQYGTKLPRWLQIFWQIVRQEMSGVGGMTKDHPALAG